MRTTLGQPCPAPVKAGWRGLRQRPGNRGGKGQAGIGFRDVDMDPMSDVQSLRNSLDEKDKLVASLLGRVDALEREAARAQMIDIIMSAAEVENVAMHHSSTAIFTLSCELSWHTVH